MSLNEKKLKICHVITRMIVGGAQENTLFTIIGHLQKGHEVVLVTGPSPGPEGELLKKVNCPEFEVVEFASMVREINPVQDIKAYFALKKFFRERKFDVVHTHCSKAGIIGRAAAWNARWYCIRFVASSSSETPLKASRCFCSCPSIAVLAVCWAVACATRLPA